jgi:hypothetical protein
MKKSFLLLFTVTLAVAASAQISKGTILVGARSNLGFSSTSYDGADDRFNQFDLSVAGGYFLIDNLVLGPSIGFSSIKFGDFETSTTSFGLFGRYYVQGKIFVGAGFQSVKAEDEPSSNLIPLEVGYAAFITDNIAIEPALNYIIGDGFNTFGLGVGFNLYLNRK